MQDYMHSEKYTEKQEIATKLHGRLRATFGDLFLILKKERAEASIKEITEGEEIKNIDYASYLQFIKDVKGENDTLYISLYERVKAVHKLFKDDNDKIEENNVRMDRIHGYGDQLKLLAKEYNLSFLNKKTKDFRCEDAAECYGKIKDCEERYNELIGNIDYAKEESKRKKEKKRNHAIEAAKEIMEAKKAGLGSKASKMKKEADDKQKEYAAQLEEIRKRIVYFTKKAHMYFVHMSGYVGVLREFLENEGKSNRLEYLEIKSQVINQLRDIASNPAQ